MAAVQPIFAALLDAGVTVTPSPDGLLHVSPASRLTDELRGLIRQLRLICCAGSHLGRQTIPSRLLTQQTGANWPPPITPTTSVARLASPLDVITAPVFVAVQVFFCGVRTPNE